LLSFYIVIDVFGRTPITNLGPSITFDGISYRAGPGLLLDLLRVNGLVEVPKPHADDLILVKDIEGSYYPGSGFPSFLFLKTKSSLLALPILYLGMVFIVLLKSG
jgi:hypothetical protein